MTPAPVLLPWQVLFLAYACGAFALRDPVVGCAALGLAILGNRLAGRRFPHAAAIVLAGVLGLCWAWLRLPAPPPEPEWLDSRHKASIQATVLSVADKPGNRLEILLEDARVTPRDHPEGSLSGLLVWTWQDPAFRPWAGQRLGLEARLRSTAGLDNPGMADWGWRWRIKGVFHRVFTIGPGSVTVLETASESGLESWRIGLRQAILDGAGPGSTGGMVLGLVTGERFAISPEDLDRVRRASLSHLLAVSGMNLAAVVAMGWGLAWLAGLIRPGLYLRLPRPKLAVLTSLPLVVAYLWLGRFEPSLTRAALMFAAWGLLLLLGRPRVLLDGLFLALAAMLLADPLEVFDVSLQLSAGAVAGLTLLLPLAGPLFARLRPMGSSGRILTVAAGWLLVTLAAQLGVLPVQLTVFGEASPNLYLNLIWVPVVEWLASPPAYLGALTVLWWPWLGNLLLSASATVCGFMLDSLAGMDVRGWLDVYPVYRLLWPQVLGYLALAGLAAWGGLLSRRRLAAWLALSLALLAAPVAWVAWENGRDRVELTMLDVGQGQSLVLGLPGGGRVLVDAGGSASPTFDVGRSVVAPALTWGRLPRLDGVILSHGDLDHAGGVPYILKFFRVGFVGVGQDLPHGATGRAFRTSLAGAGLAPRVWTAGDTVDLGQEVALEVLHPPSGYPARGNDASLVLRLTWRGRGLAILPGDAGRGVLQALADADRDLSAQVLVAPHHGSRTALAERFYAKVNPALALASAGAGNAFGQPNPDVIRALAERGTRLLDTARHGALRVRWDGPDRPLQVEMRH